MNEVDEIKKRIDIVDLISQYLELKRAGINYSACCPFHSEKTPSFMVSKERQSFRCFGCGESGDIFTFVEKMEGMNFPEALRHLADKAGVTLQTKNFEGYAKTKDEKNKIYRVNLIAAKYFKAILHSSIGKQAYEYLINRGLSKESIEKFRLGFAPENNELKKYIVKEGCNYADLALAGSPDRFRSRIMFPIFDSLNNVIGFSGRSLSEEKATGPKYLNTPETKVFHKSSAVYGINFAKDAIRAKSRAILVEGQMDVLASHQSDFSETVASSGTALTDEHLRIIGRFTPNIILAFDEDSAGEKAAISASKASLELGFSPKLTILKGFKDAGEALQKDKESWERAIKGALHPVEWIVRKKLPANPSVEDKKYVANVALSFVARIEDEIEREHYLNFLSSVLVVSPESLSKTLDKQTVKHKETETKIISLPPEYKLFSYLIFHPELVKELKDDFEFADDVSSNLYKQIKKCYLSPDKDAKFKELLQSLDRELLEQLKGLAIEWDEKIKDSVSEAKSEFRDLISKLQSQKNEHVKHNFADKIAAAERVGDIETVKKLLVELQGKLK